MKKYQDIQASDVALRNQFVQAWLEGNYSRAALILSNAQLDSKAFVESCFNLMANALYILEDYFYTGVTQELTILYNEFTEGINQFVNRRDWDNTIAYKTGNFVLYDDAVYLCIEDTTAGILPTDTTYWVYLGLKGNKGPMSVDVKLRYQWISTITYAPKDIVIYGPTLWVATRENTGDVPSATSSNWQVFINFPVAEIVVSTTEPPTNTLYDGLIWWQIMN